MSDQQIDIKSFTGLTLDSRSVKKGYLFAAVAGARADGRKFIADAIANGAAAVLAVPGTQVDGVPLISDDNPRRRLALMAAEFYGAQPERIVAVTGTNGKTSTVNFVEQIWRALGYKAASIGTLGVRGEGVVRSGSMTTPDPVSLHAELADLAAVKVTHLAMEASSHGLDQYRLDGVKIQAAAFTNLSRDHLDYHEDMSAYMMAKLRLFRDILQPGGVAVLNADIPEYAQIEKLVRDKGYRILSYGENGADIKLLSAAPSPKGQDILLELLGERYDITLPLVGDFQVMNTLCALGLVLAEDESRAADIVEALTEIKGAPGRLQYVPGHPNGAVYIDYAHTPDALETVLEALRPHTKGRLVCVFGCGGDRDSGKRPMMGKIAARLSDHAIVTDDNPRSEDPAAIRAEIMAAADGATEIGDRREAIQAAINELNDGDVLVIAGKGHERGQILADRTEPFDDYEEAEKAIERVKH